MMILGARSWGDGDRLQQAFWNVLSNAIKFTPNGGQVTINLGQVAATSRVQAQITDTGKGISSEFCPMF
ncbi:MAG: ATP-binding protein [Leptolyngbyaceae cyanobacterium SU_3_3]|nr:ATP-binding protein [Leptolyngbyaceae cyanobacterium SU_3_3]